MMYENILKDYTQRAYQNYQKNKDSEYNVTLLISSITGALSLIDENMRKKFFENIPYEDIQKIAKPEINKIYQNKDGYEYTLAFMRHLRNSLCHIKLENNIKVDKDESIETITFEDYYNDNLQFRCTLNIKELNSLFKFIVDTINIKA